LPGFRWRCFAAIRRSPTNASRSRPAFAPIGTHHLHSDEHAIFGSWHHTRYSVCQLFFACVVPADAVQLVTEQEAGYPDDPYGIERGGPTPGPEVEVVSPALSGLVKSPFYLKIKFKAHGGAEIDRDSITITYKKVPAVDITQRIRSAIRADGIDLTDAELPAGIHPFRIDVKDSRGRRAAPVFFKIGVAK
jgi:hypothetical protein